MLCNHSLFIVLGHVIPLNGSPPPTRLSLVHICKNTCEEKDPRWKDGRGGQGHGAENNGHEPSVLEGQKEVEKLKYKASLVVQLVKNPPANAGDTGLTPVSGKILQTVKQLSLCAMTTESVL